MYTLRSLFLSILFILLSGGIFADAWSSLPLARYISTSAIAMSAPVYDATMRALGVGVRWLRSETAHDPEDHQGVALVWIDDAALAPESEGGYGPLGMWDRSIYRDTFARLEQFGVRGVALDVLLSKNGVHDDVIGEFAKKSSIPLVIATTRDAKVTDPFYFSSGIATGSVDIVRSLGGAGDIVTGYASYPQSLAVRLAGLSGTSSSGEGYFLYEPKMQGVSILCLSDRPPATCPPPSWYRDRYAVIATSAIAMNDMFPTAYGWAYGGEMHAWSLSQALNGTTTRIIPEYVMVFLWILSSCLIALGYFAPTRRYFALLALLFFLGYLGVIYAWSCGYFHDRIVWWVLSSGLCIIMLSLYLWIASTHKNHYLHTLLGGYLSPQLAQSIAGRKDEQDLQKSLALAPKKVVTLFADIQDFTTISESTSFEYLKEFLDWYTDRVSTVFLSHGGYIDKFLGDGVMVLWGALDSLDTPGEQASKALTAIHEVQELLAEHAAYTTSLFGRSICMRFGLSYGEALVGSVGDIHKKQSYTAFGDAINTASRLESLNKLYGTSLLYSEAFHGILEETDQSFFVDRICLKGKQTPIGVYTQWNLDDARYRALSVLQSALMDDSVSRKYGDTKILSDAISQLGSHLPLACLDRWRSLLIDYGTKVRILSEK